MVEGRGFTVETSTFIRKWEPEADRLEGVEKSGNDQLVAVATSELDQELLLWQCQTCMQVGSREIEESRCANPRVTSEILDAPRLV